MFKYTIKAYNFDQTVGAAEVMRVVVTAANEDLAIKLAATIVTRTNYAVEAIEDLRGTEIKKLD